MMIVICERPPDGFVPAFQHCFTTFEGHPCITGHCEPGAIERHLLFKEPSESGSGNDELLDLLADLLIETEKR